MFARNVRESVIFFRKRDDKNGGRSEYQSKFRCKHTSESRLKVA